MPWGRLDDQLYDNQKILGFSHRAFRLYICGISYACRHRTGGALAPVQVDALLRLHRLTQRDVDELVDKGGWHRDGDGYVIHDFDRYNPGDPTAATRARRYRSRRGSVTRDVTEASRGEGDRDGHAPMPMPMPDPTPPDLPPTPVDQEQRRETEGETHDPRARGLAPPALADAPGFDEFWRHYPQRANRSAALDQYRRRVKRGTPPEELVAAACHLAEYVTREQMEVRYVPHAHRFLRDERDREFLLGPPANGRPTPAPRSGRRQTLLDKLAMLDDDPEGDPE